MPTTNIECLDFFLEHTYNDDFQKIIIHFIDNCTLLKYLEDDFEIQLMEPEKYLQAFKNNKFLESDRTIIDWSNGLILLNKDSDISQILKNITNELIKIKYGRNELELYAKLKVFFSYYTFSMSIRKDTLYSFYDLPFTKEYHKFEFRILKYDICFEKEQEFKINFNCSITWLETKEVIDFNVIAYSPLGFVRDSNNNSKLYSSHLIANRIDISKMSKFITNSICYLRVSSTDELKLKLSVFSNSFSDIDLFSKPLSNFEVVYLKNNKYLPTSILRFT